MKISFVSQNLPQKGALAVLVADNKNLSDSAARLDKAHGGFIRKAIAASKFTGKLNQFLSILAPQGLGVDRVVLIGVGAVNEMKPALAESMGGNLVGHLAQGVDRVVAIAADGFKGMKIDAAEFAAHMAQGISLRSYRFDKYRTKDKPEDKPALNDVAIHLKTAAAAKKQFDVLQKVAQGVFLTRDLVNEPPNVIYPESFAEEVRSLSKLGVKVEVLTETQIKALGMGALIGVAQGSVRKPRVVVMHWNGVKGKKTSPVALVGKGVTFDTGGISIKPAGGMEEMKWDMAGAGAVAGTIKALAGRKAKVNVVGIVGLVENMPDGNAQRPGDIVKSMSGQTIEVLNTDAEGRLVLCDVMWYVQEKYKPKTMVDLATLTGAIVVALGTEFAGMFSNNDKLSQQLAKAGDDVGEKLWRMPLADNYDREMDGFQSDLKNIGNGREAGSATAACFLRRFVQKDVAWAHLDIAGVAWMKKDSGAFPKGASAFGVQLLNKFIADNFE